MEEHERRIRERIDATVRKSQERLAELVQRLAGLGHVCDIDAIIQIDQNSTLPTTVSSITVVGAPNTRRSFLARIFDPLLSANRDRPYTQSELLQECAARADKLNRFGKSLLPARDSYLCSRHLP